MTCDTYCMNNGCNRGPSCHGGPSCHHMPGCTDVHCPGRPATVTRVKARHAAAEPASAQPAHDAAQGGAEIDLPIWPAAAVALCLVLLAIGASALISGAASIT